MRLSALVALGLLSGCSGTIWQEPSPCDEVNAALGITVCVGSVLDQETWDTVSGEANTSDVSRLASFMVPADTVNGDAAPLPPLFVNQNVFPLHYDMLTQAFPDYYAGLTWDEYGVMVCDGDNRTYFAGDISERPDPDGGEPWYSFIVWEYPSDVESTPTLAQVTDVWLQLINRFQIANLTFVPYTENQEASVAEWGVAPFPMRNIDDDIAYEPYTEATGYGTIRMYTPEGLEAATATGEYGYQDILVLEEAPMDLERVVSGVVTGTRQGALSHVNVRASARGTPNCYIADPFEALTAWEGELVRFTCGADDYSVALATQDEAQAWWDEIRPEPVTIPTPDLTWTALTPVLDLPTDDADERALNLSRYGSKGSNLGTLYQRIPSSYQETAFVIPFSAYDTFMRGQGWSVDLGAGPVDASFQDTITAWLADEAFRTDAAIRRDKLQSLRDAMMASPVDDALITDLVAQIRDQWSTDPNAGNGDPDEVMVRFRSSSNAEDALDFSGAGLYTSESGCVADELDTDTDGPSACDADKDDERSVTAALTTVWASLWNMQAYEERDWYGIDHAQVAMGVLVDTREKDELANVVAFTGNPTAMDSRYLVEAQIGEFDVVSAEAGVYPETELVTVVNGNVTKILRVDTSSELGSGEWVLSDDEVTELSELFSDIDDVYPVDSEAREGETILLDTEWKVTAEGALKIKQVRPFLRDDDALL